MSIPTSPANNQPNTQSQLERALHYADMGWSVFPVHSVNSDGLCSCGKADCSNPGKHPLTPNGLKAATTDTAVVHEYWTKHPNANIGIRTGSESGILVVDTDITDAKNGEEILKELEVKHGELPATPTAQTGGGGFHRYFHYPAGSIIKNSAGKLGHGVDVRGQDGYIIAPSSVHKSGKTYEWLPGHGPDDLQIAELPPAWIKLLTSPQKPGGAPTAKGKIPEKLGGTPTAKGKIPHGIRNDSLFRMACSERANGASELEILQVLEAKNALYCDPDCTTAELAVIAHSAARYEPNKAATVAKWLPKESITARGLAPELLNQFAWRAAAQSWHTYDGNRWIAVQPEVVEKTINDFLTSAYPLGFGMAHLRNVVYLLRHELPLPNWPFDSNWIAFANGVLNRSNGEWVPHSPEHGCLVTLPFDYKPEADCPLFRKLIADAVGESKELILLLRCWLYAVLFSLYDLQMFLELIGPSHTGKSTLQQLVRDLVGTANTVVTYLYQLNKSQFETAVLKDKKLALITDADKFNGSIAILKAITGGDSLRYEQKGIQPGDPFVFQGMVMIVGNEAVFADSEDLALKRRRLEVAFDNVIPLEDSDFELPAKLRAELPGIYNYIAELSEGLVRKTLLAHQAKQQEVILSSSSLEDWAAEHLVESPSDFVFIGKPGGVQTKLRPHYLHYCDVHGLPTVSIKVFSNDLVALLTKKGWKVSKQKKAKGVAIVGVSLK